MTGKGRVHVGADVIIIVFDPDELRDCATFQQPGVLIRDGELDLVTPPGKPVRRPI